VPQVDLYWISVPKGILWHLVLFLFHFELKLFFFNSEEALRMFPGIVNIY